MGLSRGEAESRVGAPRDRSCARRERGDRRSFRALALTGSGCRRSNARSGPIPLPPVRAWWVAICWSFGIGRLGLRFIDGLRFLGAGCVVGLAMGLSRGWGLRGIGPALAGNVGTGGAFALRARGEGDRFQCSLRPDPAAAGACVVGGYLPVFWDRTFGFTLC